MRISDWSSDVCSSDLIAEINPEVKVGAHRLRLSPDNALDLVSRYDLVADGSDNFPTRYLANDACHLAGRTLVSAAVMRFDGPLSTYQSHAADDNGGGEQPCHRCRFGPQPGDHTESCTAVALLATPPGTLKTGRPSARATGYQD